jgi:hypothetical protein
LTPIGALDSVALHEQPENLAHDRGFAFLYLLLIASNERIVRGTVCRKGGKLSKRVRDRLIATIAVVLCAAEAAVEVAHGKITDADARAKLSETVYQRQQGRTPQGPLAFGPADPVSPGIVHLPKKPLTAAGWGPARPRSTRPTLYLIGAEVAVARMGRGT